MSSALLRSLPCLLALAAAVHAQARDVRTLSLDFGLYQSDKATVMYTRFAPVIDRIQKDAERLIDRPLDIHIEIFPSYDEAIEALVAGEVDFVRFGPASYITAKARNPAIELIAMEEEEGQKRFKGMIVVAKGSSVRTLADLRGKRFAFGDANSTIGRYLVQAELAKAGIHAPDLEKYDFLDRHDKVARAVELGDYDAGAIKESTYEEYAKRLRVVHTFDNVTKPWVARAALDQALVLALRASLLALTDPAALNALKVSGFAVASDADYELVRAGMTQAAAFERRTTKQ